MFWLIILGLYLLFIGCSFCACAVTYFVLIDNASFVLNSWINFMLFIYFKSKLFVHFQNCLGIIYTAYVDKLPVELETLVGNIIGCVQAPPIGGPQVRFSIGAGDRQALQPALCNTLPVTKVAVALLFQQIGKNSVLILIFLLNKD